MRCSASWIRQGATDLIVKELVPGMPADACGQIRVHDKLLSVGDTCVVGCDLGQACNMIKGMLSPPSAILSEPFTHMRARQRRRIGFDLNTLVIAWLPSSTTCTKHHAIQYVQASSILPGDLLSGVISSLMMMLTTNARRPRRLHNCSPLPSAKRAGPTRQALQCRLGKAQAGREPCGNPSGQDFTRRWRSDRGRPHPSGFKQHYIAQRQCAAEWLVPKQRMHRSGTDGANPGR